jgi:hypothetical protein
MTFEERAELVIQATMTFLATDKSIGWSTERAQALVRLRELGLRPEHIDNILAINEQLHATRLAETEQQLAAVLGEVH